eukprot:TRINITY_DN74485_c0_g1_i1.p1 TRINITY_DN74485_c0_g1~~TRINITY_DN74485_c0_g1_i1.p1  ORF type:complete len:377 (+),score=89.44 TRINITY_DN74485_c0_g1_i1:69-1199(+)
MEDALAVVLAHLVASLTFLEVLRLEVTSRLLQHACNTSGQIGCRPSQLRMPPQRVQRPPRAQESSDDVFADIFGGSTRRNRCMFDALNGCLLDGWMARELRLHTQLPLAAAKSYLLAAAGAGCRLQCQPLAARTVSPLWLSKSGNMLEPPAWPIELSLRSLGRALELLRLYEVAVEARGQRLNDAALVQVYFSKEKAAPARCGGSDRLSCGRHRQRLSSSRIAFGDWPLGLVCHLSVDDFSLCRGATVDGDFLEAGGRSRSLRLHVDAVFADWWMQETANSSDSLFLYPLDGRPLSNEELPKYEQDLEDAMFSSWRLDLQSDTPLEEKVMSGTPLWFVAFLAGDARQPERRALLEQLPHKDDMDDLLELDGLLGGS